MNPSEREPFSTGDVPFSTVEPDSHAASVVNNLLHAVPTTRRTVRFRVPSSIAFRIKRIIDAERRTTTTVMEKVISDFLSVPVNKPVPYIPLNLYSEEWVQISWSMSDAQRELLHARAMSEGLLDNTLRTSNIIVVRALLDYITASPDDPTKFRDWLDEDIGDKPSEEVSDVPDSDSEEPIPEDEGIEGFEEASE